MCAARGSASQATSGPMDSGFRRMAYAAWPTSVRGCGVGFTAYRVRPGCICSGIFAGEDPALAGGSYVIAQEYLHDLKAWTVLTAESSIVLGASECQA